MTAGFRSVSAIVLFMGLLLAAVFFNAPHSFALTSGTIASWAFNENSGSVAYDGVASLSGALASGATWTSGKTASAVSFNGSTGAVTAQSASFNNLGQLTASAWIQPQTLGASNHGWIVGKATGGTNLPTGGWALFLTNSDGKTVSFAVEHANSHLEVVAKTDSINLGAWNHVAVTWDGTSQASGVKLYINGVQQTTSYAGNGAGARASDTAAALTIGNNPGASRGFNGTIDDVVVANRVFSASEIQALMSSAGGSTNPPPSPQTSDTTAPSVPTNLNGTATTNSASLTWTASTDAVGVTGYKIYRNGTQIGTATTPSYSDVNLGAGISYTYTVAAYDAAGNTSAQSTAKTTTTTSLPTSPAPSPTTPAPTVAIMANSTSIQAGQGVSLSWGSANATSCSASGGWSGTKALTGSVTLTPSASATYVLTCSGAGGTGSGSITVNVIGTTPAPNPTPTPTPIPAPVPSAGAMPTGKILWDWQIGASDDSKITMPAGLRLLDVDLFNTSATKVAEMKAKGIYTVCYINAGSWQPGYPDSGDYPAYLKIKADPDWAGEYFLDVRDVFKPNSALASILKNRLALCKQKGFDAVEPDNLQNDENAAGLITLQQQIDFNGWIADAAHAAGLKVFQKNGPDKIDNKTTYDDKSMLDKFDGIINEECQQYSECDPLAKYVAKGKLALNVEYKKAADCALSDRLNINTIQKDLNLTGGAMSGYKWNTCANSGTPLSNTVATTNTINAVTSAAKLSPSAPATSITVGSTVVVTAKLKVRSAPVLGQNQIGSAVKGATGTVTDGPISASGYTWWKVTYASGLVGWSASDWLQLQ